MTGEWFLIFIVAVGGMTGPATINRHETKHDSELSCYLDGKVHEYKYNKEINNELDKRSMLIAWSCGQKKAAQPSNIYR